MNVLRSVAAVVAGYLVFALSAVLLFQLSGVDPHARQSLPFMLGTVIYGMAFASLGGVVAMRIAPLRPTLHAAILAGVIELGAVVSLIASPGAGTSWSQWSALVLMAPCAFLVPRVIVDRRAAPFDAEDSHRR